jgi:FtsP/CotA-like multicopper oxidase with cupredoxin domain
MLRSYEIVALSVRIVYNAFGDHDPEGMMYVLRQDKSALQDQIEANPLRPAPLAVPLTIRACEGDDLELRLYNELPFPASLNLKGLTLDPATSDGTMAGDNPSSLVHPGASRVYRYRCDRQGVYHFSDLGNPLSGERGSNLHGLFGALIVEAPGSWWTHPQTGAAVDSGCEVDVHHPILPDFREYAIYLHDEMEIRDKDGKVPVNPETGMPDSTAAMTYRAEPMRNRMRLIMDGEVDPNLSGEEVHHDSWTFGDPATQVLRAYRGDPYKMRVIHGGVKETHVFHLHVHQWKGSPEDPSSMPIDSISISPQQTLSIEPLYGAGSYQRAYGDVIWHCHLYPHFHEGMWGINRIHDVLEDGSRQYPDGTPIKRLLPLPDREPPPPPGPGRLGFPLFIPGTLKTKAPRPPLAIDGGRTPTQDEINQFAPNAVPGAVFVNPAPPGTPVRRYDVSAIQRRIVYNEAEWHDPEGRMYVLDEDKAAVLAGTKPAIPLFIRANAGEALEFRFTNDLPEFVGLKPFQVRTRTYECSMHVHLVKFDPLASDGSNVGWNYDSSVDTGGRIRYRWYAESELHTVFFHDHLFANTHQQHGLFAAAIVEAQGSTYHDPATGEEVRSGQEVVVRHPLNPDFREFCLAVHDFALLFDRHGEALNPPPFPGSHEDPGVMGVNYRSAPLQLRPGDPAYVHSSWVHGDPETPVFRGYAGDPVRIRKIQGAQEEQHSFVLHGHRWRRDPVAPNTPWVSTQVLGISEAFNYCFPLSGQRGDDRDYLWYFAGIDDLWLGLWGMLRSYGSRVPGLLPLPDRRPMPARVGSLPAKTGAPPPPAAEPVTRPGERVRHFDLYAVQLKIVYNRAGDNDPDGLVFVLGSDLPDVLAGANPRPAVLRLNQGEAALVKVHNCLPASLREVEHPGVPVGAPWPPSLRVSLHAQLLDYDALDSDGATVGFNPDQTVERGKARTYLWRAPHRYGPAMAWDFADIRNHRLHGLWAGLVVEPMGSSYVASAGGGEVAVVRNPYLPGTRELVVFGQDGLSLFDWDGKRLPDVFAEEEDDGEDDEHGAADFEDQGHRGFNYRSERFAHRLAGSPDVATVFSSLVHGDPATRLWVVGEGEPATVQLLFATDKPRNHSFTLHGHRWRWDWTNPDSPIYASQSAQSVGSALSLMLERGAGGLGRRPGDYMYRSGQLRWDVEDGMWGLMRVMPSRA